MPEILTIAPEPTSSAAPLHRQAADFLRQRLAAAQRWTELRIARHREGRPREGRAAFFEGRPARFGSNHTA